MRSLPLGPEEAFVFSRVDGTSTDAEIQAATGLPSEVVAASLDRLQALGAIRFDGATQSAPGLAAPAQPSPSDPEESTDLDAERRALIHKTHSQLSRLDHYELLGVDPTADRKAIKATYYKVASVFHPDRYYGKNLGSYKAKLETIFERFTEAERVLSDPSARADYDSYLARQRSTRDLEQALHAAPEVTIGPQIATRGDQVSAPPVQPQSLLAPPSVSHAAPQAVQFSLT